MNRYNSATPPFTQRLRGMGGPQANQEQLVSAMGGLNLGMTSAGEPKKYYVVTRGRRPGIYTTWNNCTEQTVRFSRGAQVSYRDVKSAVNCWRDAFDIKGCSVDELIAEGIPGDGVGGLFHALPAGNVAQIQTQPQPFVGHAPREERSEDNLPAWSTGKQGPNPERRKPMLVSIVAGSSGYEPRGHSTHGGSSNEHQGSASQHHYPTREHMQQEPRGHGTHRNSGNNYQDQGSASQRRYPVHEYGQQGDGGQEWWVVFEGAHPGIYATYEEALVALGIRGGMFYPYPTHREANYAFSGYVRSIFE